VVDPMKPAAPVTRTLIYSPRDDQTHRAFAAVIFST
jgi:hypothetical protein